MKIDYKKLTWMEMSRIILAIYKEMKRRNPIGINFYAGVVKGASDCLKEISGGEADNFTSEFGPKEPKWRGKNK